MGLWIRTREAVADFAASRSDLQLPCRHPVGYIGSFKCLPVGPRCLVSVGSADNIATCPELVSTVIQPHAPLPGLALLCKRWLSLNFWARDRHVCDVRHAGCGRFRSGESTWAPPLSVCSQHGQMGTNDTHMSSIT